MNRDPDDHIELTLLAAAILSGLFLFAIFVGLALVQAVLA